MIQLVKLMQDMVVSELQTTSVNDALFSKGVALLSKQMNKILDKLESLDINGIARMMASGFIGRVSRNNEESMKANINRTVGVDLQGSIQAEGLQQALDVKISENIALIKSVKDEYKEKVGTLLRTNVMNGDRPSTLVTQIKDIGKVSESRAKFIARDQTAKANADITQLRAEALGSKTYVWSASMDERTRKSHAIMDGKMCKFDDDTVYSDDEGKTWKKRKAIGGEQHKPGKIYNCRCVMLPVVSWS